MIFSGEGSVTYVTGVTLLTSMNKVVVLKLLKPSEGLVANVA
jgi:hypothetical protein